MQPWDQEKDLQAVTETGLSFLNYKMGIIIVPTSWDVVRIKRENAYKATH